MRILYRKIKRAAAVMTVVVAVGVSFLASAEMRTLPTIEVAGHVVRYYDVRPGDNVYSVARDLGVTTDFILVNNPSAEEGLTSGMRLYFPDTEDAEAVAVPASGATEKPLTHVVGKDESIYGISLKYNIPVETIIRLNPQADSGLHSGQVLRLNDAAAVAAAPSKGGSAPAAPALKPRAGYEIYTIGPGETLFSIAESRGTTLDAIQVANPELDITAYEAGDLIYVPLTGVNKETPSITLGEFVQSSAGNNAAAAVDSLKNESVGTTSANGYSELQDMSVAVVLPFMSNEAQPSRAAELNREFLRGMLLGARDLERKYGSRVFIRAFDTKGNNDTLHALMDLPQVSGADIIVVPDADGQMAFIEDSDSRSLLLNYFSIKDETYMDHPNVVQANIPHDKMYDKAIEGFLKTYHGYEGRYTPVFLVRRDGNTDKREFTDLLQKRLDSEAIAYEVLEYEGTLGEDDLAEFNADITPYVFVPQSGTRGEFLRYTPALEKQRAALDYPENIVLWGYPEFITFKGENRTTLHKLGTTIYSRFYANDNDYTLRSLRNRYKTLYGRDMIETFPLQAIQGYDAAGYLVNALRSMAQGRTLSTDFEGVQSTLRLERAGEAENAGLVNNSLFLIHFRDGNGVEKTRL